MRFGTFTWLLIHTYAEANTNRQGRSRLELRTNGGVLVAAHETRGLRHVSWHVQIEPRGECEQWFFVRMLHGDGALAYSSPIWARWG